MYPLNYQNKCDKTGPGNQKTRLLVPWAPHPSVPHSRLLLPLGAITVHSLPNPAGRLT